MMSVDVDADADVDAGGGGDDTEIRYRILRKSGVPQGFECCECRREGDRVDEIDHLSWCSEHN